MVDPRIVWRRGETPPQDTSTPDDSWTKAEISDWLDAHDIEYTSSDTKAELLEHVASHVGSD